MKRQPQPHSSPHSSPQTQDVNDTKMDEANKKAIHIMKTEGMEAAVQHMCTDPATGRALTYSEMRKLYG